MADDIRNDIRAESAEAQRDQAAAEREAALNVAANEAVNRDVADANAVDARIAARQANASARELATERNILRSQVTAERAAASNNAFGFYLVLGLVLAVLIVAGFYWLYWKPNNPESVSVFASSPAPNPPTVVTTPPPAQAPPPPASSSPAPVVVNPPAVHNNITVPPSPPAQPAQPAQPNNTDNGGASSSSGSTGSDNTAPSGQ